MLGWAALLRAASGLERSSQRDPIGMAQPASPFLIWRGRRENRAVGDDSSGGGTDDRLWSCLVREEPQLARSLVEASRSGTKAGPLVPWPQTGTIEVWTETEFSGLQALGWLALLEDDAGLMELALGCARWHLEHTQPDNATNRPWGIGLFCVLSSGERGGDARYFAEVMLHACRLNMGRPDALSADILRDAAEWLEGLVRRVEGGPAQG